MKNKLIGTIILFSTLTTLFGCNINNTVEDTKNQIEDTADKAGDSLKDASDTVLDDYSDEMMNLDKDGFIKKVESKGFKISEVADTSDDTYSIYKFSVPKDELMINDQRVAIYTYSNKETLDKDVRNIENDNYFSEGSKINEANPPHIYRSGKLLVIYSGTNSDINNLLKDIFGTAIK